MLNLLRAVSTGWKETLCYREEGRIATLWCMLLCLVYLLCIRILSLSYSHKYYNVHVYFCIITCCTHVVAHYSLPPTHPPTPYTHAIITCRWFWAHGHTMIPFPRPSPPSPHRTSASPTHCPSQPTKSRRSRMTNRWLVACPTLSISIATLEWYLPPCQIHPRNEILIR